jgi:N-acetylglucosaminyldiphosphoundecaprenol N-acetyl-beta-D-mannosaminyltransferase
MSKPDSIYLAGVRLDDINLDEVVTAVESMINEQRHGLIATVNAEFIVEAQTNRVYREAINTAALSLPDGSGPTILAHLRRTPLQERIPGVDLAERLVNEAAERGWRVFLLGGANEAARKAAAVWTSRYPDLQIAGTHDGSSKPEAAPAIVKEIRASKADIIFVAFSFPRQELWITENIEATGAAVGIGLGGTFDYVAGLRKRAPKLWRRLGLEWLYRFITQPWRYRRMIAVPHLVWLVLRYGAKPSRP